MMTKARGTALGSVAIAGWSVYGVLIAANSVTPPFRSMAIVFSFATAALLLRRLWLGEGFLEIFRIPAATLALGVTGLFGNNVLYAVALALGGAPVPVNIASLSWPVFMMALVAGFGIARPTWLDAAAVLIGFGGVALLALQHGVSAVNWPVVLGLVGAFCWALYSALRNRVPAGPRDSMLAFVGVSAAACWALTLFFEQGSVPLDELARLALVGVVPVGLANLAWDFGTRHGDPVFLAGLSFLEPIASTALIAVVLSKPVGPWDAAAGGLVLSAVLFSIVSERRRRRDGRAAAATSGLSADPLSH
ncbi:MAG TPA: DMT family transporter [Mesorhizobium sp.]|jgi:drug/metabolite transporter (DMT)-like permease|nr:DMT family transporter [Mesorhizobium sp.]